MQAEIMDQPTAALFRDLKQRGLLDDTLVVWATEFGRMPFLQGNGTGRDHNPEAFTCFLAGAGVKKDIVMEPAIIGGIRRRLTQSRFMTSMLQSFTC